MQKPLVGVLYGSKSDTEKMQSCLDILDKLQISYEVQVLSAHRNPEKTAEYARTAESRGLKVIIAGAGLSAALPGVVAAHTALPVIGVPIAAGSLGGIDSLLSIAQMPGGVPVACVGINNAKNAALLAASILALGDDNIQQRLEEFRFGND